MTLFAFQKVEHRSCKQAQNQGYEHSDANDHQCETAGIGGLDVGHAIHGISRAILRKAWMGE